MYKGDATTMKVNQYYSKITNKDGSYPLEKRMVRLTYEFIKSKELIIKKIISSNVFIVAF